MSARALPLLTACAGGLLLTACAGGTDTAQPHVTHGSSPQTTPSVATGTGSAGPTTPSTPTTTQTVPGLVTGLGAALHDELRSVVEVTWEQSAEAAGYISYSFDEHETLTTPAATFTAGAQRLLLLGIPYEEEVTWQLVLTDAHGVESTSEPRTRLTGNLPAGLPVPTVEASEPDLWEPTGRYLLASVNEREGGWLGGTYWKFIIDRQGRVVWAMDTPDEHWSIFLRVSYDGDDILWDEATYWSDWDSGARSRIHRMKIDGTIVESYDTPGLHHAFTELDDGTLVWGAAQGYATETLQKLNPDGSTETIWDCAVFHDEVGTNDTCQSNTLYWHEPTDTFLYSFYTTDTLVEIDHVTGETLSAWGTLSDWTFDPEKSRFSWQHGCYYTEEGTLLLSSKYSDGHTLQTVAREYIVDDKSRALREVWNFGEDGGLFADTAGEAHRLPAGNTLHNYGSSGRVREVTSDGQIVWDIDWPGERLIGRSVFLNDLYVFHP